MKKNIIQSQFLVLKGEKSLKQISKESGISENTLESYSDPSKKNIQNIKLPNLIKLAEYFNVSLDELVFGKNTSNE